MGLENNRKLQESVYVKPAPRPRSRVPLLPVGIGSLGWIPPRKNCILQVAYYEATMKPKMLKI